MHRNTRERPANQIELIANFWFRARHGNVKLKRTENDPMRNRASA